MLFIWTPNIVDKILKRDALGLKVVLVRQNRKELDSYNTNPGQVFMNACYLIVFLD